MLSSLEDIIGVEGIKDVEEYNRYDQMNLFTDLLEKIKDEKLWVRKDGESRIVTA